jgi:hypothetical protein
MDMMLFGIELLILDREKDNAYEETEPKLGRDLDNALFNELLSDPG